ncbi:MAG: Xaa-Pro peptidase family protein [Candidatus Ratteibacteria bacterium]
MMDFSGRINRVRMWCEENGVEAFVGTSSSGIFYLTGLRDVEGVIFVGKNKVRLFLPDLYLEEGKNLLPKEVSIPIMRMRRASMKKIFSSYKKIACIGSEFSVDRFALWKKELSSGLVTVSDFLKRIRAIKEPAELLLIRKAEAIAQRVMEEVFSSLQVGMTELDLAAEVSARLRNYGAERESFPIVAAGGMNTLYPHHTASHYKIRAGDPVMLDFGALVEGYVSDLTETCIVGEPSKEFSRIHSLVSSVRDECMAMAVPGAKAADLHKRAVYRFRKEGLSRFFVHGLGHGVGIDVHESPSLTPLSADLLLSGMVLTVEPGLYLPGKGGVRLEKMVYVGDSS